MHRSSILIHGPPCCQVATIGAVVGLVLASALSRFLESFVFEVGTTDPWVLSAAAALSAAVALLAAVVPARRAAAADPIHALAAE